MIKRKLFMIGVETYAAMIWNRFRNIFSYNLNIHVPNLRDVFTKWFPLFWMTRNHVITVINMQYKAHAL